MLSNYLNNYLFWSPRVRIKSGNPKNTDVMHYRYRKDTGGTGKDTRHYRQVNNTEKTPTGLQRTQWLSFDLRDIFHFRIF